MTETAIIPSGLDPLEDQELDGQMTTCSAIVAVARAEIDIQITTARAYPRSINRFKQTAQTMATLDEETAASCFYVLPRGGKSIEGPSARLAEIVAAAWGNLRFGGRVVDVDDRFVTAQGVCHDLERNIAVTIEVRRRITDKNGNRFNDDMIGVTSNAAISIALRNAVFKIVPKAYWNPVWKAAMKVAAGDIKTLVQRRTEWFRYFTKYGVTDARILAALGKPSIEDVDQEDMIRLSGLCNAIKDGDTTVEQAFPPEGKEDRAKAVKEKLKSAPAAAPATPPPAPPPAAPDNSARSASEPGGLTPAEEDQQYLADEIERAGGDKEALQVVWDKATDLGKRHGKIWESLIKALVQKASIVPSEEAAAPKRGAKQRDTSWEG
jgi:hypothetical protein